MRSVKSLVAAGAASLLSSVAFAADMPSIAPPPPMDYAPPPVEDFGEWYLRGDIGFSNQRVERLNNVLDVGNATSVQSLNFNTAGFYGLGVGYRVNNWFRADVTGEYRGNSQFFGTDRITYPGGIGTDTYHATKNDWVVLANAYVDLGTWWCITPFIGAGVGVAYNKIEHFRDTNVIAGGGGWAESGTKTNLAWALHAGASYKVTSNFAVELSYRYLNLGKAETGTLVNLDPTLVSGNPLAPVTFNNLQSHDVMLSMRWLLQQEAPPPPPYPIMRKG
jgi:opacity protein-like surface antigen